MSTDCSEIFRKKKVCPNPFILLEVLNGGNVAVCCPGRLKDSYKFVGNILDHSLNEIWNGRRIQVFRDIMYSGEFGATCEPFCPQVVALNEGKTPPWYSALCEPDLCQEIEQGKTALDSSYTAVSVSSDGACNLYCIMCRPEKQARSTALEKRVNATIYSQLLENIKNIRFLELTGNGDPFFSRETVKFMERLAEEDVSHLTLRFITNGQLLDERRWEQILRMGLGEIRVAISIDAATKGTYETIRRGGKWEALVTNMEMLSRKRQEGSLKYLQVSFVVMKCNLDEMIPFVALAKLWHCDRIEFQRVMYDFAGLENIFDNEDPKSLEKLAEVLRSPVFDETDLLDVSSLLPYRDYRSCAAKARAYRFKVLTYQAKAVAQRLARILRIGAAYRHLKNKIAKAQAGDLPCS